MVVIKKKSSVIPVDFGEFKLEFSKSDENLKRLDSIAADLEAKGKELSGKTNTEALDKAAVFLKGTWDRLFGEGAYEKVDAFADHVTIDVMTYLVEAINGLNEEILGLENKEALKRYLGD